MIQYTFLVPLTRNSDKQPHTSQAFDAFEEWLLESFDGYTVGPIVRGEWIGPHGPIVDYSREYRVSAHAASGYASIVAKIKVLFNQHCVHVATTDAFID